ncbi:MAG: glycosyltransferase [Micavibrio aeruginosavorus]|uniref:Glycosyltransferase n=1 Tax=Micavibrio aeruginosavorus TaxID=349221 RepID=A0A7T5UIG7_9BACT|nr:MAG: glycosyltransferase [Micavibrio aeruginosavorus]
MKILQVMAGAAQGGAETAFVDMCIALHEAGEEIEVVTRKNPARQARLQAAGLKVHILPFGGVVDIFTTLRMRKIIREFKPHIIQTWMSRAAQRTPRWSTSEGIPRYLVVSRLGGYYKAAHFAQTDYYSTITPDIRRHLIEAGIPENKIRHINNFAELEPVGQPVDRAALNTPPDAPLLLALGRLHQAKAMDVLLRAVSRVPGAYLWIAGDGPDRAALEAECTRLGLDDRVRFLGWRDDRAALFATADICVFPSRYEPFGTVFVQAWAQRVPLVTTASDGPRQYVRDGEDGLMVPVDDIEGLAAAIQRVVADPDLRARLTENGYRRYQAEFTKSQTVAAYLGYYHDILKREGLTAQI